jgi:hypothetical protein
MQHCCASGVAGLCRVDSTGCLGTYDLCLCAFLMGLLHDVGQGLSVSCPTAKFAAFVQHAHANECRAEAWRWWP